MAVCKIERQLMVINQILTLLVVGMQIMDEFMNR